jgi:type II secretory pathway component PulL
MTTLRILVAAPLAPDRAIHWSLHDASGTSVRTGHDVLSKWPAADRVEIVIAASQVRLASVTLPPLPANRVAAAAAFALEDQLANPADDPVLVASSQRPDGRVVVAIVGRSLLASLRLHTAMPNPIGRIDRALAEPELAAPGTGWCWCAPDNTDEGDGFVRVADGSAFPVGARPLDGSLPPELDLALAQAVRGGSKPKQIRVDATVSDDMLAHWESETGIPFVRGTPWRWYAAPTAAFATATHLLQGEFAAMPPRRSGERTRSLKAAIVIAVAALALHVIATLGEWAWWRIEAWRTARAIRTLAISAGVKDADAATPEAARLALVRRYAEQRHAHRLPAPNDALPLLARAGPALVAVPPGLIKSANYADGHWTLDLQRADAAMVRDLDARLKRAGTPAMTVTTPAGARVRFGID